MITEELIEQLKKEDPTGKCHVRMTGGAVLFCERKAGYWDGPYQYIKDKKYIISTRGNKVDIHTSDYEDWIWDHDGDYSSIELDFAGYSGEALAGKIKDYKNKFEKTSKECKEFKRQSLHNFTFQILKKVQEGWKIVQPKDTKIGHHNVHYFIKKLHKKERLCQGESEAVIESGFFEPVVKSNKSYIHWRLIL